MSTTRWIIGNWKSNGSILANRVWLEGFRTMPQTLPDFLRVGVCVPYPYLSQCHESLSETSGLLGVQDISAFTKGAYTGEVTADMAKECGAQMTIVGHSERRALFGESSAMVAQKAQRALAEGLIPIVCVGETLSEREEGHAQAKVGEQLKAVLTLLGEEPFNRWETAENGVIIAYEPIWAIGTGKTATPDQAQSMHAFIQTLILQHADRAQRLPILYGGSMNAQNAALLLAQPNINGGLIGGASLSVQSFLELIRAAY